VGFGFHFEPIRNISHGVAPFYLFGFHTICILFGATPNFQLTLAHRPFSTASFVSILIIRYLLFPDSLYMLKLTFAIFEISKSVQIQEWDNYT
jgi:hypothetical protein